MSARINPPLFDDTTSRSRSGSVLANRGFIPGHENGIFNRAVVMNLSPSVIDEAEQSAGAELQIQRIFVALQHALFPADSAKRVAEVVQGKVVKLYVDRRRRTEDAFINLANFVPSISNASDRMRHGGLIRRNPIALHQHQVAGVERAIELAQCAEWVSGIDWLFTPGSQG